MGIEMSFFVLSVQRGCFEMTWAGKLKENTIPVAFCDSCKDPLPVEDACCDNLKGWHYIEHISVNDFRLAVLEKNKEIEKEYDKQVKQWLTGKLYNTKIHTRLQALAFRELVEEMEKVTNNE